MALDVATALTTVEDVRLAVGLSSLTADQTAQIEKAIKVASAQAATYLGRPLGYAVDVEEKIKGFGTSPRFSVRRTPVWEVVELLIDDVAVDDADIEIESGGRTGLIALRGSTWAAGGGGSGVPFTGSASPGISADPLADSEVSAEDLIFVTYTGGWRLPGQTAIAGIDNLPFDIQGAVDLAAAQAFQKIGRDLDVQSEKLLSEATTFVDRSKMVNSGTLAGWPVEASEMLKPYRRISQH